MGETPPPVSSKCDGNGRGGTLSRTIEDEQGSRRLAPQHRARYRTWLSRRPGLEFAYRIVVGVVGGFVLAAGVFMIPYPGPGWLVVFGGLAILGSEYTWARRLLHFAHSRYQQWTVWMRRQRVVLRLSMMLLTGLVAVVTLWLVNVFGLVASVVGLDWSWLQGPIG